ncbi:MAG: 3D domain-containing protein [FCB group bacterium]|nr:3D domain-containing protein [FCB group bacterium]
MMRNKKHILHLKIYLFLILIMIIPFSNGCTIMQNQLRPHFTKIPKTMTLRVTSYCACEKCCGWKFNWLGQKAYAYGPQKGQPKVVGKTASGIMAKRGTIAADTDIFPFGTIMYIEGYGYGRVEDRGSTIKGYHIDIFFKDHQKALAWGNQNLKVKVWLPE